MPTVRASARVYFSEAARAAAAAARRAKREGSQAFGLPELFIVKADDHAFTWELRRFGGLVLQRGPEAFASIAEARADGGRALAALCASSDLPRLKRQTKSKAQGTAAPPSS